MYICKKMIFDTSIYEQKIKSDIYYKHLCDNKKVIDLSNKQKTRSLTQNGARWLYLEMIATLLNERGDTFTIAFMNIEVPYTKDNLYQIYWQSLRLNMFPKKTKQLNTKEFAQLTEMAQMMFAEKFNIDIPFPNMMDKLHKEDLKDV